MVYYFFIYFEIHQYIYTLSLTLLSPHKYISFMHNLHIDLYLNKDANLSIGESLISPNRRHSSLISYACDQTHLARGTMHEHRSSKISKKVKT
jgi:hypothetical protein